MTVASVLMTVFFFAIGPGAIPWLMVIIETPSSICTIAAVDRALHFFGWHLLRLTALTGCRNLSAVGFSCGCELVHRMQLVVQFYCRHYFQVNSGLPWRAILSAHALTLTHCIGRAPQANLLVIQWIVLFVGHVHFLSSA